MGYLANSKDTVDVSVASSILNKKRKKVNLSALDQLFKPTEETYFFTEEIESEEDELAKEREEDELEKAMSRYMRSAETTLELDLGSYIYEDLDLALGSGEVDIKVNMSKRTTKRDDEEDKVIVDMEYSNASMKDSLMDKLKNGKGLQTSEEELKVLAKNEKVREALASEDSQIVEGEEDLLIIQANKIIHETNKVGNLRQFIDFTKWISGYMQECEWDLNLSLFVIEVMLSLEEKVIKDRGLSIRKTLNLLRGYIESAPGDLALEDFMKVISEVQVKYQKELISYESSYKGLDFKRTYNTLDESFIDMVTAVVSTGGDE